MATRKRMTRKKVRSSASGAGGSLIIYVHGIGAQSPNEQLKLEWDLALFGRDMKERTRMAYWSDILHPEGRQLAVRTRRVPGARDRMESPESLLEQAGIAASNKKALEYAEILYAAMEAPSGGTGKKVIPLPGFLRRPLARVFLESFIKDTAAYFFRTGMRAKIQQRLIDQLPSTDQPITLVAHSQGSIVALEVLDALPKRSALRVNQLVTIGSPLGIREVQDFLTLKELRVPACVTTWHNFADPVDPVALDKGLANDYDAGAQQFLRDDMVLNTRTLTVNSFNPHSAVGYLAHPSVRVVVHESARVDSRARFLFARDVAAQLAFDERQSVLIEILEPDYPAVDESRDQAKVKDARFGEKRQDMVFRIERAAEAIEKIVTVKNSKAARIDKLRRFVSAHLTPSELYEVAREHQNIRIYAVWRSTMKRKLLDRSVRVVQADAAQASYNATGKDICWAVLDTGARRGHPHFKTEDTIIEVWDCTKPGSPKPIPKDEDRDGHGSHVAGIIAGSWTGKRGNESFQMQGIAPLAKLIVYKVLKDNGEGEDAWIIKALDHISAQNENNAEIKIHGVNLSLGGPFDSSVYGCGFSPICAELRRLWRSGVLVCVASGNEGQVEVTTPDGDLELNNSMSIGDPANLEECIAVGSVNADKPHLYGVSSFSSRGPTSDGRMKPDVIAPGERILSCNSRYRTDQFDDLYRKESGTSMAAPHVSGLLAAFLSVRREFRGRPDEVKELLLRTCTDIRRDRYHQGHGIPNLMRMLLEA